MARITRVSTEPSPTPASNTRTAGGSRMDVGELFGDAVRDLPLLAAGVDEQQIFLPVVEEAEIALRIAGRSRCRGAAQRRGDLTAEGAAMPALRPTWRVDRRRASRGWCMRSIMVERSPRAGCDDMKPWMRSSVSVVMRPPLRSRAASLPSLTARRPKVDFGKAGLAAIVGNFLKELLRVHGVTPLPDCFLDRARRRFSACLCRADFGA